LGDRREFLGQALVLNTEVVVPSEIPIAALYACTASVDTMGVPPNHPFFLGISIRNHPALWVLSLDPRVL